MSRAFVACLFPAMASDRLVAGEGKIASDLRLAAYAEYWWPDDSERRDIDLLALTLECEYRFHGAILSPFSVGALGSLVQADGTVVPDEAQPDLRLDSDAWGASLGVFARIHGFEHGRTSSWFDISGSVLWTDDDFPAGGSEINGMYRSGLGFSHTLDRGVTIVGGLRYGHVSNGSGINSGNPAYDALSGFLGMQLVLDRRSEEPAATLQPGSGESLTRGSTEWEYFVSVRDEHRDVAMLAMSSAVEYRLSWVRWLSVTVSGSFYYVSGHDDVPAVGMGMFNAGSVGQSLNLGLRAYPWRSEGWSWYIEGQVGMVVSGHFTRAWPFAPDGEESQFVDPRTWSPAARYGTGVEINLSAELSLQLGYRRLHLDNYDYATTPDYEGHGGFVALGQRF